MANKSRSDIKAQIFQYLPKVNQSAKDTLINNVIDLAVEEITNQHDFRIFKEKTYDTFTMSTGSYFMTLNVANFTTMCASTTPFKYIRIMRWLKQSGGEDYGTIRYLDDLTFHEKYGYIDYSSRTRGYPVHYTIIEDRVLFNCPVAEYLYIRCYYQKTHGAFDSDDTPHRFATRSNMTAFMYIVYRALLELKVSLSSAEFPQEIGGISDLVKKYAADLIAQDVEMPDEEFEIGWAERSDGNTVVSSYDWVT